MSTECMETFLELGKGRRFSKLCKNESCSYEMFDKRNLCHEWEVCIILYRAQRLVTLGVVIHQILI